MYIRIDGATATAARIANLAMHSRTDNSAVRIRLAAIALAALVSACGGGGGGDAPAADVIPGTIDVSFGKQGLFDTRGAPANLEGQGTSVSLDGAGRVLAAGWVKDAGFNTSMPAFARIRPEGTLDPAFGIGGYILGSSPVLRQTSGAWAFPVAGGNTVLVHTRRQTCPLEFSACVYGPLEVVLRRVGPDGTPDPSYPETILERTYGRWAIAEPDGAVLISAIVDGADGIVSQLGLRRVAADGQPDVAFAQNSDAVLVCPGLPGVPRAYEQDVRIARFADGRIVIARWDWLDWDLVAAGRQRKTCIARLNADGTLDTTFGQGGRVYVDDGGGEAGQVASVVAILPGGDGGIALVMNRRVSSARNSGFGSILWLAADGAVQVARGDRGLTKLGPQLAVIASAATQADGRIVLAGAPPSVDPLFETGFPPRVVRLTQAGQFDAGFGADRNGVVPIVIAGTHFHAAAVVLSPDGAIHVAGNVIYDIDPAAVVGFLAVVKLSGGAPPPR